jgi:AcrR family transcriptional regulator
MKENILNVAAELISKYGLKKFTIDEIAKELKISKKTIYQHFQSKDEIIRDFFITTLESDQNSVISTLNSEMNFLDKIHSIIYSNHTYRIPLALLNEAKQFYPAEWAKIEELKHFKTRSIQKLLEQAKTDGIIKPEVHFGVLSKMLEEISDIFIDYPFLLENKLTTAEAIDEALKIVFQGVIAEKFSDDEKSPFASQHD